MNRLTLTTIDCDTVTREWCSQFLSPFPFSLTHVFHHNFDNLVEIKHFLDFSNVTF